MGPVLLPLSRQIHKSPASLSGTFLYLLVRVGMRTLTVRQICLEQIWTCVFQHGREAMKYMEVFHTKCLEHFAQAPPARRVSTRDDTNESRPVGCKLLTVITQNVAGLFSICWFESG